VIKLSVALQREQEHEPEDGSSRDQRPDVGQSRDPMILQEQMATPQVEMARMQDRNARQAETQAATIRSLEAKTSAHEREMNTSQAQREQEHQRDEAAFEETTAASR